MKIKIKNRYVGENCKPYIIAEIGSNHNGNMNLCKKLIYEAKKAGADAVKFQLFSVNTVFSKKVYDDNYFIADDYRKRKDYTLKSIVQKYSISISELKIVQSYCKKLKIHFGITPFSFEEMRKIKNNLKPDFIKIASMDCNNYEFVKFVGKLSKKVILSTGLSDLSEINKSVRAFEESGNKNLIILHCIAEYPPEDNKTNLRKILTFKKLFPYPIGFSDHSKGIGIALGSIALGACVVEKHFTIDKKMEGWDHHMSLDQVELKELSKESHRVFKALGSSYIKRVESNERIEAFRRSIVAKIDIKKNHIIKRSMLEFKRPGTGLSPENIKFIIGRKAKKNIYKDKIITTKDF